MGGSATILAFAQEVLRDVNPRFVKAHVLELDKQLLSPGCEKCQVLTNGTEVVGIFLRLKLAPAISHLCPFQSSGFHKGRCAGELLPFLAKEDIVVDCTLGSRAPSRLGGLGRENRNIPVKRYPRETSNEIL